MVKTQLFHLHTQTMKLAIESLSSSSSLFREVLFIHAQFHILIGGTGQNVPSTFYPIWFLVMTHALAYMARRQHTSLVLLLEAWLGELAPDFLKFAACRLWSAVSYICWEEQSTKQQ